MQVINMQYELFVPSLGSIVIYTNKSFLDCADNPNGHDGYGCQDDPDMCSIAYVGFWYDRFRDACKKTCNFCEGTTTILCNYNTCSVIPIYCNVKFRLPFKSILLVHFKKSISCQIMEKIAMLSEIVRFTQ